MSEDRSLVTERVQPGFVSCRPQGRLPGCRFEFDAVDDQCRDERRGMYIQYVCNSRLITKNWYEASLKLVL